MAKEALELGALALASWAMERDAAAQEAPSFQRRMPSEQQQPVSRPEPVSSPMDFLREIAADDTRFYRAQDYEGALYAAFYGDGRVRLADERYLFAGMVDDGRAHLVQIGGDGLSEAIVRTTPSDALQLEFRGGPYGGRVLTCESFTARTIHQA